jgi:hypothetical protein
MKPNRRTFLRQAGTLIALGVVMPAPSLRAAVPPGPPSLGVLTDSSGWSIRLRCLGWAKMVADIRRLSSDSVAPVGADVPAAMSKRIEGRAEITLQPSPDGPNYDPPDFTLTFTQHGSGSPVLQMDLDCQIESPITIIPGIQVACHKADNQKSQIDPYAQLETMRSEPVAAGAYLLRGRHSVGTTELHIVLVSEARYRADLRRTTLVLLRRSAHLARPSFGSDLWRRARTSLPILCRARFPSNRSGSA